MTNSQAPAKFFKFYGLGRFFKHLLTEKDNQTHCLFRLITFIYAIFYLAASGCSLIWSHDFIAHCEAWARGARIVVYLMTICAGKAIFSEASPPALLNDVTLAGQDSQQ